MKKILVVVGTRPNFIKITCFREVAKRYPGLEVKIVHTGQHFDPNMSGIFFSQFNLQPDFFLETNATSPVSQMGQIMTELEKLVGTYKPDLIITPGDVNSTLATSLVANKMGILLAHLESGLRSFDRGMPEEINRIIADELADHYFVTEPSGVDNLRSEGKKGVIHFVGNTMIDTLVAFEAEINRSAILADLGVSGPFVLMTIHRPATVDTPAGLRALLNLLEKMGSEWKVIFPVHPRTISNFEKFELKKELEALNNLVITGALGYFEFQKLVAGCSFVLTDSGGIQEETTFRQVPCLTLRPSTERPVTVEIGTNTLIPFDHELINRYINEIKSGTYKKGRIPEFWDGHSTERIIEKCAQILAVV